MVAALRRSTARVLWVEGKDDSAVTKSLCAAHGIPPGVFEVLAKTGVDGILDTFFTNLRAPGAECFGIVVDADGSAQGRWDSIRSTLEDEGYENVPERLHPDGMVVPRTAHRPQFGAWIMPDNASPGALEEFATLLVPDRDALLAVATKVVDEIPADIRLFPPARRQKALIRTWLAWQESPGSPMGQAITKGDLRADAPAAQRFVGWLRRLMLEDAAEQADETPA